MEFRKCESRPRIWGSVRHQAEELGLDWSGSFVATLDFQSQAVRNQNSDSSEQIDWGFLRGWEFVRPIEPVREKE